MKPLAAMPLALNQHLGVPGESYSFIQDDRLLDAPEVKSLARAIEPVLQQATCQEVLDRFLQDSGLYAIPVVDEERNPVALVDRNVFLEFFSHPYSREIFGRYRISALLRGKDYKKHDPIIVEESCSIEDVTQIIISGGMQHMVTGFMVTTQGKYLGIANGHDLLNLITQHKQAKLFYLAHYDHLTGLPNRMLLSDRIQQACADAERKGQLVALLFIDVDRFKTINDSLGHSFGDAVLRSLVTRLKGAARKSDTVARIGGDEFVILMENLNDTASADAVAQRVLEAMQAPVDLLGHAMVVTVSIGIALYALDTRLLEPKMGKRQPDIISDFLPKGKRYKRAKTLGHLWEFQYALAVELEHGKTRGSNVTNNHPLLTALVVVAHLTEDKLYYARLWEMETGGSLFNAQLEKAPTGPIMKENMRAKVYLQQRLQERVENA